MSPTLPPASALLVEPYRGRRIRRGDVVVCRMAGAGNAVAHRITSIIGDRITTRGDANRDDDPWTTRIGDLVGQVRYVYKGTGRHRVHGGLPGLCIAEIAKARRFVRGLGLRILRRPLLLIGHCGVMRKVWSLTCKPKVIRFERSGNSALLLLVGGRVVGRYVREHNEWMVRYPFSLFVDTKALPKP